MKIWPVPSRTWRRARQVYAASFLAIEVDTEEEREYLIQLQTLLNLDDAAVAAIRSELGLA